MNDDNEVELTPEEPASGKPGIQLPTLLLGILIGGVLGLVVGIVGASLKAPTPEEVLAVEMEWTDNDLKILCGEFASDITSDLEAANIKVKDLAALILEREEYVVSLETDLAEGKATAEREIKQARASLAAARQQYREAQAEQARLVEELEETVAQLVETKDALEEQVIETKLAQSTSRMNNWQRFVHEGELKICERGNRKRMNRCREAVQDAFTSDIQQSFEYCLKTDQATPTLVEIDKKAPLPEFAQWLNSEEKMLKGWAVVLCDPSLPEAIFDPMEAEDQRLFDQDDRELFELEDFEDIDE